MVRTHLMMLLVHIVLVINVFIDVNNLEFLLSLTGPVFCFFNPYLYLYLCTCPVK